MPSGDRIGSINPAQGIHKFKQSRIERSARLTWKLFETSRHVEEIARHHQASWNI
jgi:hypothetical protein